MVKVYLNKELFSLLADISGVLEKELGVQIQAYPVDSNSYSSRKEAYSGLGDIPIEDGSLLVIDSSKTLDTVIPFKTSAEKLTYFILLPSASGDPGELARSVQFLREFFYEKSESAASILFTESKAVRISRKMFINTVVSLASLPSSGEADEPRILGYMFKRVLDVSSLVSWRNKAAHLLSTISALKYPIYQLRELKEYLDNVSEFLGKGGTEYTVFSRSAEEADKLFREIISRSDSMKKLSWPMEQGEWPQRYIIIVDEKLSTKIEEAVTAMNIDARILSSSIAKRAIYINAYRPIPLSSVLKNGEILVEPIHSLLVAAKHLPAKNDTLIETLLTLPANKIYTRETEEAAIKSIVTDIMTLLDELHEIYNVLSMEEPGERVAEKIGKLLDIYEKLKDIGGKTAYLRQLDKDSRDKIVEKIRTILEISDSKHYEIMNNIELYEDIIMEKGLTGVAVIEDINLYINRLLSEMNK